MNRTELKQTKRWVIKIGSALLTDDGKGLNIKALSCWVAQMATLKAQGVEIILVSSGSIAEGMARLGWAARPTALNELQAAAAVGQMGLIQAYESQFSAFDLHTAQVLMTHDDLSNRKRYLNIKSTIQVLLKYGVIPIINENDTVVTDEICFGDNDTLAALTANLISAEVLVILTDQKGLYTDNPRENPNASLIDEVHVSSRDIESMAREEGGRLGKGGMYTKVMAAKRAARSGTATLIASGNEENILPKLWNGDVSGTLLIPDLEPLTARQQWLAGHLQVKGIFVLDDGAVAILKRSGRSLLPVGVVSQRGDFSRGEMVVCYDSAGQEIARGLVNYSALETIKLLGKPSDQIEETLGYVGEESLIHCDNLIILNMP
ncbi:Glutamate 5-kinase / RNA-binding C-terminal domain PUA [hydrothermal vent metagenome]|uniref:Glutamate 5-kinase / RNA-binding C-terminal domain PUA n=1 Tax=hydrothermal vent metagenome TaxID=652676 RepID=A0A3B0WGW7_9ZZZZ